MSNAPRGPESRGKAIFAAMDTDRKLDKAAYEPAITRLRERLGEIQRQAGAAGLPAMIIFEGWDASGKGVLINDLMMALDPRGFRTYSIGKPTDEEKARPFFWRFWARTPPAGKMAIFSKSWYSLILEKAVKGKESALGRCDEANDFEKALADDGYVIVKLFLHIGKKEQKKRIDRLESDPVKSQMVAKSDREQNKHYERYLEAIEAMVGHTDTAYAPWSVVEAGDRRYACVKIIRTVIKAMERGLDAKEKATAKTTAKAPVAASHAGHGVRPVLSGVDLSRSLPADEYKIKLDALQDRLKRLQIMAYKEDVPVAVVFEGWDAAGKGGGIKRLTECMDPRGYQVNPTSAPNDVERQYHYLWRFWNNVPARGRIAIFDRSWYGRVLVERVEGLCTGAEWSRAYGEINEMERQMADFGTVIVKLWLHIDMDEQMRRFESREFDMFRQYKLTDEDWRNRGKWDSYVVAADEMLAKTGTAYAPWTIVESDDKYYSRIKLLDTVANAMEKKIGPLWEADHK